MSYSRQFYAPQGWYEEQGAAPGQTPTMTQLVTQAAQIGGLNRVIAQYGEKDRVDAIAELVMHGLKAGMTGAVVAILRQTTDAEKAMIAAAAPKMSEFGVSTAAVLAAVAAAKAAGPQTGAPKPTARAGMSTGTKLALGALALVGVVVVARRL